MLIICEPSLFGDFNGFVCAALLNMHIFKHKLNINSIISLSLQIHGGLSREDLERIIGADDSSFNGMDLATLIRKKYGRSYDVQLIKKVFS